MSTHKHLDVKPSEPNEEYCEEISHDEAFSRSGLFLSVLAAHVISDTGFVLPTSCEAFILGGAW